jgi:lipopolysaccharide cholinephosphotransferase
MQVREDFEINQMVEKHIVNDENYKSFCYPYEFINGIYDVVKFTKELCEKENIEYFIDGGTMLGCIRDGGQILYDNDADFGMTVSNFKKLLPFKDEFEKQNYKFIIKENCKIQIQNRNIYIVHSNERIPIHLYPALDVLIYKPIKEGFFTKYVIQDQQFRKDYPNAWHYQKHLYPLKDYIYQCLDAEPLILKGANNPKNYLDGTYPGWQTKKIYDHKTYTIQ